MEIFWFSVVALMITVYTLLDGFDLGCGALHFYVARSENERRTVLRSIGPVWDGNEVWLLAAGGVLYFAFPTLYASSFSGFYLPLMIVLWLLIGRGISIELRSHIDSPLWKPFWDAVFMVTSGLLALMFGAALGNVVRGVPLEPSGYFFLPLWSDFGFGPLGLGSAQGGILDWYTLLVGLLALTTLLLHGTSWLRLKTDGAVYARSRQVSERLWWGTLLLAVAVTIATLSVQPQLWANLSAAPWGFIFPAIAIVGLLGVKWFRREAQELAGFLSSCVFIAGMLSSAAFGVFPFVLPASTDPELGLTIYNAATSQYGLGIGLLWWIPGVMLATGYFIYLYSSFSGKVRLDEEGY